jgi:hypothetical protein
MLLYNAPQTQVSTKSSGIELSTARFDEVCGGVWSECEASVCE